ncbi:hypothetical protein GCM10010191_92320 [Actinomadura vinacea]|uniref:Lipoprotein n=1 Tax=Actinomadura vinacea TaxID=115336 RepID=A0ABN3KFM0_9ACTN
MRRPLLWATLPLLAAVLTGCSGEDTPSKAEDTRSKSAAPGQAVITWLGKVCAADADLQVQRHASRIAALSMVPRRPSRDQIVHFAKVSHKDLQETLEMFEKTGPSPVAGGDQAVAAYINALKPAVAKLEKTKEDVPSPAVVANTIQSAVPKDNGMQQLFAQNPALNQVYKTSPQCKGADLIPESPSPGPT